MTIEDRAVYAAVLSRIAAEAAQRPRMRSVMPTSRGHGFASHGPLGCFVVTLLPGRVCPATPGTSLDRHGRFCYPGRL